MIYDYMVESLVKVYSKALKKHPVFTLVSTILIIAAVTVGIYLYEQKRIKSFEQLRLQNLEFNSQLTQLDNTERNLKGLLLFVQNQREQLKESQTRIEALKKEHKQIKPIVEVDRQTLDSIFQAQEQRQRANVWKERWMGFGFGILASLIASIVWYITAQLIRKSRNPKQLS